VKYNALKTGLFSLMIFFLFGFISTDRSEDYVVILKGKPITFKSADGLTINANIYDSGSKDKPIILLFHQAGYSRGEYLEIGPKLMEMGYTCMAIDQRSGDKINGVLNETFREAERNEMPTAYPDAYADLEATLKYAKENFKDQEIIVWGSSYSSSLVFILASKNSEDIKATISFSPGKYFEFENKPITAFASQVSCPTFITSAKNEEESWREIHKSIPTETKVSFLPDSEGKHGSKALWKEHEGHQEYWTALSDFLENL